MDPLFQRPRTTEEQTDGLALFDATPPNIQTPPPSAPGSKSSEDAADCVSNPMRAGNHRLIMVCLAEARLPMSMAEISKKTGIAINVICARLDELRPLWVKQYDRAARSAVKPSLRVDGFLLTESGLGRVRATVEHRR